MLRPHHLAAATAVARAHPSLQLVLDHLGKPRSKISGLPTLAPAGWSAADIAPFLDVALEPFGAQRLVFGSDWPVCTSAASYAGAYELAAVACRCCTADESVAVLGGNARCIYGLG